MNEPTEADGQGGSPVEETTNDGITALHQEIESLQTTIDALRGALDEHSVRVQSVAAGRDAKAVSEPAIPRSLLMFILAVYLLTLTFAEISTTIDARVGLIMHAVLLVVLSLYTSLTEIKSVHHLFVALAFAPLIRLVSLTLPLSQFPVIYWYVLISLPLMLAARIALRNLRLTVRQIGFTLKGWPVQLLIGASGVLLGYVQYQIIQPDAVVPDLTWENIFLPAVILLVATGLIEEFIFRGIMQHVATAIVGRLGIVYVALVAAIMHVGYHSALNIVFVAATGIVFGWIVQRTHSLVGVAISHGIINIMLFLILPSSLW